MRWLGKSAQPGKLISVLIDALYVEGVGGGTAKSDIGRVRAKEGWREADRGSELEFDALRRDAGGLHHALGQGLLGHRSTHHEVAREDHHWLREAGFRGRVGRGWEDPAGPGAEQPSVRGLAALGKGGGGESGAAKSRLARLSKRVRRITIPIECR